MTEVLQRKQAWEQWRRKEQERQRQAWAQRERDLQEKRRRVQAGFGMGLDDDDDKQQDGEPPARRACLSGGITSPGLTSCCAVMA